VWDWSGIFDRKNLEANGWDGADGRFTAWAWALDLDVNLTEALVEGALSSGASGELSGEWGGFLSTLVAESASGLPSDDVTSSIGDGDDGVVKRSVNVSDAFGEGTLDFLLTCRGGFTFFCSSHCLSPSLFSRFFLIRDGLSLTFAGTSVGSGALTVNWEATLMADATVAADFG
jgi:hypothetical protein